MKCKVEGCGFVAKNRSKLMIHKSVAHPGVPLNNVLPVKTLADTHNTPVTVEYADEITERWRAAIHEFLNDNRIPADLRLKYVHCVLTLLKDSKGVMSI
jgi:3'-phosphoadenosine 5'-phosphosulfate sulfotransferase (PAPS reductase)/FAD synthetase